ncbi:hypothetical protein [Bradyrhizobium sp. 17]|uniref:hypothetical protein n=1 Tax=Bradyrhizobium sp. 17 TaxID=2782649 RepID=UPI001FF85628|nr:hypothetical protein [Bradyrhizobium sp. 17]MCK1520189.1 hypothetical protein [Bradyrhizobium sp. 17]
MNSGLRYPEIERMGSATVEADDIKRFFDGMAAANRRSTHMSDVAQAVGEPVAFVPIHPRQGPLWSDTIPAGSEIQRSNNYPRMALYASQPSPAATVETDAKKRQELAQRLVYVANSMSETMSQGFDSKLFVDPEMRDDLIAAAGLVAAYKRGDAAHSHSSAATEDEPRWYAVDERGNDNFATSIYEAGDKGLLVARCNQNGQYPWQGPAIIRGLAANKQIVPIEPQAFPKWRHLKRGSIVSEVARGFAQVAHHPIEEMTAVVIYKHDADGVYWVRNAVEFDDGRFEPLPSSQLTRPAQQRASNK